MAPVSHSTYFPPLEGCLSGERVLLSWAHVATALSDQFGQRQTCPAVACFLADDHVHSLLQDPSTVFAPPNEAARKLFETMTAPINVASDTDIKTFKADAEWLSKNANINLVAALRVVVVEFQHRPISHLMGPLSSQDAANLQEAAGLQNGQGASFLSGLSASSALDSDEIAADFERADSRRRRLFTSLLAERRSCLMAMDYLHSIKLYDRLPIFTATDKDLALLYKLNGLSHAKDDTPFLLSAYLKVVSSCMTSLEAGFDSLTDESLLLTDGLELEWLRSLLTEVVHALSVVFQIVDSLGDDFPPSGAINQWFSLMDLYSFFDSIQPIHPAIAELLHPLRTLSSAISIALLKLARSLLFLADREDDPALPDDSYESYLLLSDVLEQIHKCVLNAASEDRESASPVIFSWNLLLHRMNVSYQNRIEKRDNLLQQNARESFELGDAVRPTVARRNSAGSIFSIESSKFDSFLESGTAPKDMQLVEQLAASVTTHGQVFDIIGSMATSLRPSAEGSMSPLLSSRIRNTFLELLKVSYPIIGYQSEPVSSLLSLLAPGCDYWDLSMENALSPSQDVLACMLHDDHAVEFYLQQALDRFPYEFLPFITLCKRLCTAPMASDDDRADLIVKLLRKTPSIAFTLPQTFSGYELVQEDENTNTFCLVEELPLISLSSSWSRRCIEDDAYRLPAGTCGRFITDTGRVVLVDFPHSTLSLLGRRLEINLAKEGYCSEFGMLQPSEVAQVISLFSTLLRMEYLKTAQTSNDGAAAHRESDLLHEASKHISGGKDLVSIVCETMDYFVQDEPAGAEDVAVEILTSCVAFLDAILPIQPSRVWSYLARSELLSSDSRAGKLSKITGTLDLVSERFDLLMASLSFFSRLIETTMCSAVQRRASNKLARQKLEANPWVGTADKVLTRVSLSVAQASVDVLESTSTWRFDSESSRLQLMSTVVPVLDKIVLYSYSMGESPSSDNLMSSLRPAASYVVDCFMSPSTGTLQFGPILTSFGAALKSPNATLYPQRTLIVRDQLKSVVAFCSTLLRAADYLDRSSTMLETYLFKSSTLLARLSAWSDPVRSSVIRLLESLVINAAKSTAEPPSLLGYLDPQISRSFLQSLSSLGKPFALAIDVKITWTFFSSILRNRQQWMSNCLLTGQTPREAMKEGSKKGDLSADSMFACALGKLKGLKDLDNVEALAILDFVASAQNHWPWTVFTLLRDTSYVDGLRSYVRDLKPSHLAVKSDAIRTSADARVAAYVAETLAMQLYHSRHQGTAGALAKSLVVDLDYYLRDGVAVAGYNKSLHSNFAKNFANKYFGCSINLFKRTPLEPGELGSNYYYNLDRASDMLGFDPGWLGRRDDGFKNEMELANANLSLVDAQIALFHAWKFLLVELSTCLPSDETVTRHMLQVVQQCFNANQGAPGPESIFLKLVDARANLALILIQRLVKSPMAVKDINQLLTTLVATIHGSENNFTKQSIVYNRTLLKALFVTLRAYQVVESRTAPESAVEREGPAVNVAQTVLNVLDHVVGRGFRSLVGLIHDKDTDVVPEDLALLTAITQACLSLPTIDQSQTQVLNIMASHDVMTAATSLFSWADQLSMQGDPVYGELSVLFLLELSSLPLLAEQLACDGILSNLLSANLVKYMLKANLSPYADAPMAQRCYSIWAKGLLPLMINLLASLGATLAPEIAYVLNQFSHLLETSVDRFEPPGASRTRSSTAHYLTLLETSEIHSLALLTRILATLRVGNSRDIPIVDWDSSGLLENVDFWLSSKRLLKERLLPLGPREMEWRNTKVTAGAGGFDNLLEQKMMAQLETVKDVLSEEPES